MPRNRAKDQPERQAEWMNSAENNNRYCQQVVMMYEEDDPGNLWNGREAKIYGGRPMISRDTPINGGVYIVRGAKGDEVLVVDDIKYPEVLGRVYQDLLLTRQFDMQNGRAFEDGIFKSVLEISQKHLPYNNSKTNAIAESFQGTGQKVTLDEFIIEGCGVCRHQALLAAYLLEKLKREGYLNGTPSVDRNKVKGVGGHAWVRYTDSSGEIFIIDPAQNYIGRLKDMQQDRWFYERPSDKLRLPYFGVRLPKLGLLDKFKKMMSKTPELILTK